MFTCFSDNRQGNSPFSGAILHTQGVLSGETGGKYLKIQGAHKSTFKCWGAGKGV